MIKYPKIDLNILEQICKTLCNVLTGTELTSFLNRCFKIDDPSTNTKWKRLFYFLPQIQDTDNGSDRIYKFIETVGSPTRFIGQSNLYENFRSDLNEVLLFIGLRLREDGKLATTPKVTTLSEAEERTDSLRKKLHAHSVHPEILRCCSPELLQKNYFHSVLEASKSTATKLRQLTGIEKDGVALVLEIFPQKSSYPKISFNHYQTDTEKSEVDGLKHLLISIFKMYRNVTAHEPKVDWAITEEEAIEAFLLISVALKKLDKCFKTGC